MLMEKIEVIKSIGKRTGGDIYLGVVGAVRTGNFHKKDYGKFSNT